MLAVASAIQGHTYGRYQTAAATAIMGRLTRAGSPVTGRWCPAPQLAGAGAMGEAVAWLRSTGRPSSRSAPPTPGRLGLGAREPR